MKKIGLVGGLGPASTVEYYLGLVSRCRTEYGSDVYPEIVIDSVNMRAHTDALERGDYDRLGQLLLHSLTCLKAAGAEIAAVTANTEHIIWDQAAPFFPLPVVSILDAVAEEINRRGYRRVLVFGTEFTMNSGMYETALSRHGITAILPSAEDIRTIGGLIYPNLENGIVIPSDRMRLIALAQKYIDTENADAFLLGCTELPLAIKPDDVRVPVLNSTELHLDALYQRANEEKYA